MKVYLFMGSILMLLAGLSWHQNANMTCRERIHRQYNDTGYDGTYTCKNGVAYHSRYFHGDPWEPMYNTDGSIATCDQFYNEAELIANLECEEGLSN